MLALDTILRDGRTSISEMYNELKIFINDANPINIATDDINITTNDNITTDTDVLTSTSIIDTSITNDDINITTDTNIADACLLTFEDVGIEQNAVDDKIDDINVKNSNNDSSSGNNLIIQRLRLLLKVMFLLLLLIHYHNIIVNIKNISVAC